MALTKVPSNLDATVAITQSASDNSTNVATTAYVTTALANLVDGAPSTLNTLDEIAAALNDDAALNTTLTTSIATKLPLAGGTMTGTIAGFTSTGIDDNAGSTSITIDSLGNVGIGTSDQIGEKLTVNGSVQVLGNNDPNYSAKFISAYDSTHGLRITTRLNDVTESEVLGVFADSGGANPRLVLNPTNGWKVGIGTDTPQRKLTVTGSADSPSDNTGIFSITDGTGVNADAKMQFGITSNGHGYIHPVKPGTDIKSLLLAPAGGSGRVGIGMSSTPAARLHVDSGTTAQIMRLERNGSAVYDFTVTDGGDGAAQLYFQAVTNNTGYNFQSKNASGTSINALFINPDGNIGVGTTSPGVKLDIAATIGDQSPLLRGTASNTSTSNFNWISEFLMPNLSGGHRVVHAIGTARSNGNAATIGFFEHASASGYNALNVGLFGNNDIFNVCYNGNVGIMTQTPDSTLTVNGQIESLKDSYNEGGQLILRAPSSVSSSKRFNIDNFALSGASAMRFFSEDDSNGGNGAVHMYIKANGYVGINTAPNYQLDVRGQNSGTNGHMAYIENNGGGGNGCTFSVQHTDGNHSWGVVQELRIQSGSGTDNPSLLFSSGAESTNTWTVGYGYTDVNFRIKRDHGYHNGGWGTSLFTMDRSGNVTIGGTLTENSDERLKENIVTIPDALDKVSQLRGVTFDWKERDDEGNVKSSMGLIAQEVEAVAGLEVLVTEVAKDGSPEMEEFQPKGVTYQNMVGLLIEAIKELKTENNDLKSRLDEAGL